MHKFCKLIESSYPKIFVQNVQRIMTRGSIHKCNQTWGNNNYRKLQLSPKGSEWGHWLWSQQFQIKFLRTVSDKPQVPGYTARSRTSNSLSNKDKNQDNQGCGHVPILSDYFFMTETDIGGDNGNGRHTDRRAWFQGNYIIIIEHFDEIDWDHEFCHLSTYAMPRILLESLRPLIEAYVPLS